MADFFTNAPISEPILYPDSEVIDMKGFAFTHSFGIILQHRERDAVMINIDELLEVEGEPEIPQIVLDRLQEEDLFVGEDKRKE